MFHPYQLAARPSLEAHCMEKVKAFITLSLITLEKILRFLQIALKMEMAEK